MTWISATDPLALVAITAGQIGTPIEERGAAGDSRLDVAQEAIAIGSPVPIVFARRRDDAGGILVSPGATEARFENDNDNAVTASYHLVVSEGQIDSIPVKDIFQRSCRVGSHTQTYNRRAGEWEPGNFIVARDGYELPECPYYCGTVGTYPDMSTLSFTSGLIPDGFDYWNRQVHAFIRGGMRVTRLEDSVLGPSDSFADLAKWLMLNSSRLPTELIDDDALEDADLFLRTNGFWCNCELKESRNYEDLIATWGKYFLLGPSNSGGKKGLRPVLPTTTIGSIDISRITPVYEFSDDTIMPDTFEVSYTSLSDRLPFVAQMTWRQQLEDDFGIVRTAEVRFANTADVGPYESHDLSEFCTTEQHAVRVGAYIVAKRVYTSHTARFTAKPETHNTLVNPGDIVRVRMARIATTFEAGFHDYLYQVERIIKTLAGDVSYELTHFPVNSQGSSLVALAVSQAVGTGIVLTSNRTGISCDINSSTDDTIPDEEFTIGTEFDFGTELDLGDEGLDFSGGGDVLGPYAPGEEIDPAGAFDDPPDDGCEYKYTVTKKCGEDAVPIPTSVPDGGGFIISEDEPNCIYWLTREKICPGEEPEITTKPLVIEECVPDPALSGTYSPTGLTTVTVTGPFLWADVFRDENKQPPDPPTCSPGEQNVNPSTVTMQGVTGVRVKFDQPLEFCGAYTGVAVEVKNAAGQWLSVNSIGGGFRYRGWIGWGGAITFSSTAADAKPVGCSLKVQV